MVRLRLVLLTSLFLLAVGRFAAAQVPVFGPEVFLRSAGTPQPVTRSFSVQDSDGDFTLVIQNGEGKRGRVSSAVIEINGVRAVGPNAFNKQLDTLSFPVVLQQNNEIVVELRSEPGTSLIVSIIGSGTPAPSPVSGVTVVPDGFPINQSTQVRFTAAVPYTPGGPVPTVELQRLATDGSVVATEGAMVDNGQLSQGDEIQGDGIFGFRKSYLLDQPAVVLLRVKASINSNVFYSGAFSLTAFMPITDSEASAINAVQVNASQLYYSHLAQNKNKDKALDAVVAFLKTLPIVKDAGVSAGNVWIKYTNGMEGGLSFNPPGTRGGPPSPSAGRRDSTSPVRALGPEACVVPNATAFPLARSPLAGYTNEQKSGFSVGSRQRIGILPGPWQQGPSGSADVIAAATSNVNVKSTRVLVLSPFLDEFGNDDDGSVVKGIYETYNNTFGCPQFEIVYLENGQVGVGAFKALGSYGIVHVASHGSVNNNRVVVYTKTSASAQNLQTYQSDLLNGRLTIETINGRSWLAATPAFFSYYVNKFEDSLLFFGSCFSTSNNSLSNVLIGKGAKTYLGFSGLVNSSFAQGKASYFHQEWVNDQSSLITTGQVFNGGCDSGGACWQLKGANNLVTPSGDLENGGFEAGALGAWTAQGDGRVLSQLGTFSPTEGNYLGLVSTGLGFTVSSGAISQKACIAPTATALQFDWNFISEEFREYCGSIFQDFFRVDLVASNGATTNLFFRKVDDVCSTTVKVPFSFDRGDAWATGWSTTSVDISAFAAANAGKAVTVRFSAGDVGDSIYDTAILIDKIVVVKP